MAGERPRTLLIGLDGATWDLITPAGAAGKLPKLRALLARSARGKLRSVDPPVTIPAWYCAMTGRSPPALGAWGFSAPGERPGKMALVSTYRPQEALWDLLSRRGSRVGVVNFPALPAPSVHGYYVGGMLGPPGSRASTYPAALAERLDKEFGPWLYDVPGTGRGKLGGAVRSLGQKARLIEALEKEAPSDLLFVLLCETDRVQHDLYDDLVRSLRVPETEVDRYWEALDTTVDRLVRAFHGDREGYTLLLSDHGFGSQTGEFYTNRFLQRAGFLEVGPSAPGELGPRLRDLAAFVDRLVPLGKLRQRRGAQDGQDEELPKPLEQGAEDGGKGDRTFGWYSQFVDWERTRAFSFPIPEGIYANFYRGEPTEEERRALKEELTRALRGFAGAKIEVVDPEVAYGRPTGPRDPLLLIYAEDHAWETHGHFNHHRTFLNRRPSFFGRQGTHRPDGIVALSGPGVLAGELAQTMPLLSMAPTLLDLWGLPPISQADSVPFAPLLKMARGG